VVVVVARLVLLELLGPVLPTKVLLVEVVLHLHPMLESVLVAVVALAKLVKMAGLMELDMVEMVVMDFHLQ